MSTEEDRIRLVMEYVGGAGADALRAKQAALKTETLALVAAFSRGEITEKQFADASKVLGRSEAAVEQALKASARATDELTRATHGAAASKDKLAASTKKAESGLKGFGQTGLQTGRIVQDFAQGGIGGVLNNIEGFTQAIGLGPGAAGALTILGVAAFVAGPHLKEMAKSIGFFGEEAATGKAKVEQLKKKIEELESKPHKLSLDFSQINEGNRRIEQLEKRLAAFEANRQTAADADLGHAASKAVKETIGSEALQKGIAATRVAEGDVAGIDQKLLDAREKAQKDIEAERATEGGTVVVNGVSLIKDKAMVEDNVKGIKAHIRNIQAAIDKQYADAAKEEAGAFATGDIGAVARVKSRAAKHPGVFPPEFRRDLEGLASTPEQVADRKQEAKAKAETPNLIDPKAIEGRAVQQGAAVAGPKPRTKAVVQPDGTVKVVRVDALEKERRGRGVQRQKEQLAETVAEREARQAEQAKTIDETIIPAMAAAEAGDLRAQGGGLNRFGQFKKMNAEQQRNELHHRIMNQLKMEFPSISKEDAEAQARRIGGDAVGGVGRNAAAGGAQAIAGGLNQNMAQLTGNQAAQVQANAGLLQEMAKLNQRMNQIGIQAGQQAARARNGQPANGNPW